MKNLKKLIALTLTVILMCGLAACKGDTDSSGSAPAGSGTADTAGGTPGESSAPDGTAGAADQDIPDVNPEKHVIAVANTSYIPEVVSFKNYCENYVAEALNIEFLFSEELGNDPANMISFAENAYNSGAEVLVDFACANRDTVYVLADKCEELGMYLVTGLMPSTGYYDDYEYVIGSAGKNPEELDDQFYELMVDTLEKGAEPHSVVVCTMNAKLGVDEQITSSMGILEALKDMYNLTYDGEIRDLVMLDSVTEISTGRDDVKVTIFPTFSTDDMNEVLKGEYDVVALTGALYLRFESTIAEAEKAYNRDIKIVTMTNVCDTTENSYTTLDIAGNPSLNGSLLLNQSRYILPVLMAVNTANGDQDAVMRDGKATEFFSPMWVCHNADEYEEIKHLDQDESTYVYTIEDLKQMIKYYNPSLNADVFAEWAAKAELDSVKERRGI
ncbi:hypothetical protein [Diplocloster modestus]|uniref:Sugar ABC transporter substrate-binding protein n=1 Tax=Diplocloster modestus TaxID=2850322 RepID=A0ABS6KEJ2_9FIRM|nr:hypothetical protein [Diplocloster modestus]MBU9728888.1 hypothetical protein [Diplocloster modestus]